ncbi:hypothetical protein AJ88_15320 [Mesorhizobium amorphae CCBAU 01583]|nr:hypothetical protein AJ88_15320 [Mesorhizobium amorphae CCBAU 01583]
MVQGQELSIERIAGALIRHRCLQCRPIHVIAFRQSCQIVKVPEINPSAPVIPLLEKVVHDPVQGPRLRGRNFHPKTVSLEGLGAFKVVWSARPKLQHSSILLAGRASIARNLDIS